MVLVMIGAALQASAHSRAQLVVGRILCGVGTGIKTSTVPMYQSELCDRSDRGKLVSAEVMFIGIGIVIAYWFDFGMSFVSGSIAWRLPIAFQATFAVAVFILVFGLPESPRWLYARGHKEEALAVLCAVHDMQPDDDYIMAERVAIDDAIELEARVTKKSFWSIFKNDEVKTGHRVFLAWAMQFMNQASGINLVVCASPFPVSLP
ncbi:MFS transporter [Candidatus Bathyarchaeota archaeon]|nr:MFS transporter [Candidatus Bathyarchaeota archaeon]